MPTRPQTHRARGLARREALLQAAVEIVGERGVGGATHRAIAQRAGVPASTTTYFFASIDELILEAIGHFTKERVAQFRAVADALEGQDISHEDMARLFAETCCAADTQREIAQFEAYLDASRRDAGAHRPVAAILEAFEEVATAALRVVGTPSPEQVAPIFVAIADGYALRRIALGTPVDPAPLADAFLRLFRSYSDVPAGSGGSA